MSWTIPNRYRSAQLEMAKLHIQKVPVALLSSLSSEDEESEVTKEQVRSIFQIRDNFR